jgi:hypothetical protein
MPRLEFKKIGDYHVITSPDVPALYVAHLDREQAIAMVPDQVKALRASAERRASRDRVRHQVGDTAE